MATQKWPEYLHARHGLALVAQLHVPQYGSMV